MALPVDTDARLSVLSIQNVTDEVLKLNNGQFTQELTAQIQSADCQELEFTQEAPAQIQNVGKAVSAIYKMDIEDIEKVFLTSPVARINWASQMVILDSSLPLGIKYWYMKQSVEMGWSSNDTHSRPMQGNRIYGGNDKAACMFQTRKVQRKALFKGAWKGAQNGTFNGNHREKSATG